MRNYFGLSFVVFASACSGTQAVSKQTAPAAADAKTAVSSAVSDRLTVMAVKQGDTSAPLEVSAESVGFVDGSTRVDMNALAAIAPGGGFSEQVNIDRGTTIGRTVEWVADGQAKMRITYQLYYAPEEGLVSFVELVDGVEYVHSAGYRNGMTMGDVRGLTKVDCFDGFPLEADKKFVTCGLENEPALKLRFERAVASVEETADGTVVSVPDDAVPTVFWFAPESNFR